MNKILGPFDPPAGDRLNIRPRFFSLRRRRRHLIELVVTSDPQSSFLSLGFPLPFFRVQAASSSSFPSLFHARPRSCKEICTSRKEEDLLDIYKCVGMVSQYFCRIYATPQPTTTCRIFWHKRKIVLASLVTAAESLHLFLPRQCGKLH